MKNIPTIFIWDRVSQSITNRQLRMVDWVFQGKGIATRKYDGIAVLVKNDKVFLRHEWREGEKIPPSFIPCQDPDPKRPHAPIPGWVPVSEAFLTKPRGVDERALKEAWGWLIQDLTKVAFNNRKEQKAANPYATIGSPEPIEVPGGTYELCGPKIRGNHEKFKGHVLIKHGGSFDRPVSLVSIPHVPRNFEGLKKFLESYEGEGIVWHYNFGVQTLMAKIKRRDFGFTQRIYKEDVEMAYPSKEEAQDVAESLSGSETGKAPISGV